ncbi:MAG: imidazole glycerol phosphate synthase subunit HisH [Porphyromonadaceae bacterium]|nr:imidazole glycerol phosphate synthase subunit HisH [Porphyromonadaceae bacterium]
MQVAIVKYNAGNIYSVECALRRAGVTPILTDDKEILMSADKVIFPGVGEAATTMAYLREHGLDCLIRDLKQPVLGICIGMQLMCRHSEEGNVDCLGIFDVDVKRFCPETREQKVPHMGWNTLNKVDTHMFPAEVEGKYVYFVHSYYVPVSSYTTATTDYIHPFSAALQRNNFYAIQFHMEKSGVVGESILHHFLSL